MANGIFPDAIILKKYGKHLAALSVENKEEENETVESKSEQFWME